MELTPITKKVLTLHLGRESQNRLPRRAGNNANANYGLAYVNANNAGSNANTNYGVRLNLRRNNSALRCSFI